MKAIVKHSCEIDELEESDEDGESSELCNQSFFLSENSAPTFSEEISNIYTFERSSLDSTEAWNIQLGDVVDQEGDDYEISYQPGSNTFITYDQGLGSLQIDQSGVQAGNYTVGVEITDKNAENPLSSTYSIVVEIKDKEETYSFKTIEAANSPFQA